MTMPGWCGCELGTCGPACTCICHEVGKLKSRIAELERQLKEADERRQAAITMHDKKAGDLLFIKTRLTKVKENLDLARVALKWVWNHRHRHTGKNHDHDMNHAKLALEEVEKAIKEIGE